MKSQSETLYDFLTLVRYKTAKKDDIGGLQVSKEIILIQYLFSGKKNKKRTLSLLLLSYSAKEKILL